MLRKVYPNWSAAALQSAVRPTASGVVNFGEIMKLLIVEGIVIGCILLGFGNSVYHVAEGKAFHGLIIRSNYVTDEIVLNSLLSMYCKTGMLRFVERLFNRGQQNKECWNFVVFGYGDYGTMSVFQPKDFAPMLLPLVYACAINANDDFVAFCAQGSLTNIDDKGMVVLCQEGGIGTNGAKSHAVKDAGDAAMILMNSTCEAFNLIIDVQVLPSVHEDMFLIIGRLNLNWRPSGTKKLNFWLFFIITTLRTRLLCMGGVIIRSW